jgi:hypothetical protein
MREVIRCALIANFMHCASPPVGSPQFCDELCLALNKSGVWYDYSWEKIPETTPHNHYTQCFQKCSNSFIYSYTILEA